MTERLDLIKDLLKLNDVDNSQDRAALNQLIMIVAVFQGMFGISNDKMRKFLTIMVDFITLEMEKK